MGVLTSPTVLSLDIWDTVLRRHCHPDAIKLHTAQAMIALAGDRLDARWHDAWDLFAQRREIEAEIGRECQAAGGDDEYEIADVLQRQLERCLHDAALAAELAERLVELEIRQELAVTYADPQLLRLIADKKPARLIAVSDFYMTEARLRRLLAAKAPELAFERVFVSCDHRLNKRSGRLFRHITEELGVAAQAILHVGDNAAVDVERARACGLNALHFVHEDEERLRDANNRSFSRRQERRHDRDELEAVVRPLLRPEDGRVATALYNLGVRQAPVFAGFAAFIQAETLRRGADSAFFMTREGVFFKAVYDALQTVPPFDRHATGSHLLEVSRIATFVGSLRGLDADELMRIWSLYSRQSVRALLRTLDLDAAPFAEVAHRHGLELDEVVTYPWQDARMRGLLADPAFRDPILRHRDERRDLLRDYLGQQGFLGDGPRMVVDIGWRGSIQDNLALLLPETPMHGLYLGLQPFLNEQPANATKRGFLVDANVDEPARARLVRHVRPIEMMCNVLGGSVTGYRRLDAGIEALRLSHRNEDEVHERFITHFHAGILAATPAAAAWIGTHAMTPRELSDLAHESMRDLLFDPPHGLMAAFFSLEHNESFGVGGFYRPKADLPLVDCLLGLVLRPPRQRVLAHLTEIGWPHATLRRAYFGLPYQFARLTGLLGRL
jgi:HAD superfamily hydrolase (TIGR01549 family)